MNRPDRFWRSIDVLATAYLQGKLQPYECNACAVGNLIAADLNGASPDQKLMEWPEHADGSVGLWPDAKRKLFNGPWSLTDAVGVLTGSALWLRLRDPCQPDLLPMSQYSVTDTRPELATNISYTNAELIWIENALLRETESNPTDDEIFEGLMAVVDVLFDIHEVEDEDLRGQAKSAFKDQECNTVDAVL